MYWVDEIVLSIFEMSNNQYLTEDCLRFPLPRNSDVGMRATEETEGLRGEYKFISISKFSKSANKNTERKKYSKERKKGVYNRKSQLL